MVGLKSSNEKGEDDLFETVLEVLQGSLLEQFVTVQDPLLHFCC